MTLQLATRIGSDDGDGDGNYRPSCGILIRVRRHHYHIHRAGRAILRCKQYDGGQACIGAADRNGGEELFPTMQPPRPASTKGTHLGRAGADPEDALRTVADNIAETFYQCNQATGESVVDYVAELRRLSTKCEFREFLSDALRDQFVCGLCSPKALTCGSQSDIRRALQTAQTMEAADWNVKGLQGSEFA